MQYVLRLIMGVCVVAGGFLLKPVLGNAGLAGLFLILLAVGIEMYLKKRK